MSAYDLWRKGLIDFSREDEALNMEQFVQFIFFRDAKISAQGLRRDLNKIKKDLQEIVFSWIDDAGFLRLDKYEVSCNILECLDEDGKDDYIYYLLTYERRESYR